MKGVPKNKNRKTLIKRFAKVMTLSQKFKLRFNVYIFSPDVDDERILRRREREKKKRGLIMCFALMMIFVHY